MTNVPKVNALSVVVRYPMLVSQSKCVARRYKHASTTITAYLMRTSEVAVMHDSHAEHFRKASLVTVGAVIKRDEPGE